MKNYQKANQNDSIAKANQLSVFQYNDVDVIDSRQVAEMIGKNHKDLMRSIREYVETLDRSTERNFAPSNFFIESSYKDSTGRTLPCYLLTKKGCDMVANKTTGEKGVLFTAAYVTAFEEMRKNQELFNVPKDYPSALRALADAEEKKMLLAQQNAVMQPKAEYYDALVERDGLSNFRNTAKLLGVSQTEFINYLISHKYIYRDKSGHLMAYANKNDGLFGFKECLSQNTKWSGGQTMVTMKGRELFMRVLTKGKD